MEFFHTFVLKNHVTCPINTKPRKIIFILHLDKFLQYLKIKILGITLLTSS